MPGSLGIPAETEFDRYAGSYDQLVRDPLRSGFASDPRHFLSRKWEVLSRLLASLGRKTESMNWLDVGCGRGELLDLAGSQFAQVAGCDPSAGMLGRKRSVAIRRQEHPTELPFPSRSFDLVTAVCVYHHVTPEARAALTHEIRRVLRPDGLFCLIEHNPYNPVTRRIVSRCPVDVDAKLLYLKESTDLLRKSGLRPCAAEYFLYLPERWFPRLRWIESAFAKVPLGGQYVVLGQRTSRSFCELKKTAIPCGMSCLHTGGVMNVI